MRKSEKVIFRLEELSIFSKNILNKKLIVLHKNKEEKSFKIINYLGKGTVGQVYLIESQENIKYVIKISNNDCKKDLSSEVKLIEYFFTKFKINHPSYPIYSGDFDNLNAFGVIYPYLGFYNLEKLKRRINYKLDLNNSISIIKQLITQLIELKNIIHGDLKSSNVVVNIKGDNAIATIIDFGLIKYKLDDEDIISTNYITSPESLLSLKVHRDCVKKEDKIDFTKHDYYGIFTITLDLFLKDGYWQILSNYLSQQLKLEHNFIISHEVIHVLYYVYYKFFCTNKNLLNESYKNLINKVEKRYELEQNKFLNFDNFFNLYIVPNIDNSILNLSKLELLKDFLLNLVHFDPKERLNLEELLLHPFLEIKN